MTKLADSPQTEHAKNTLAEEKKISDKSRAQYAERMKGKPTPTQEECDLAMLGAHILEHEHDGSDPDPNIKQAEAANTPQSRPQTYATRQVKAEGKE